MRIITLAIISGLFMTACASKQDCDTIYFNARIHVMDEASSVAEAMAVRDGRICAIGTNDDILNAHSASAVVDLHGNHVFPGFIDAHAHLHGLGEEAMILTLHGTASADEVLDRVRERAARRDGGLWIHGRGWDQNDWPVPSFPNREELDKVAPDHPVLLVRIDGHAAWVNSRALAMCGIDARTPDPEGGRILRGDDGRPTGILLDNAIELVRASIPKPTIEEMKDAFRAAVGRCLATGMTGMHDMGMSSEYLTAVRELIDEEAFPFRMVAYIDGRGDTWEEHLSRGRQSIGMQQLTIAGLKLYADGALGSRGAWLLEPYQDDPGNSGIPIIDRDSIAYESGRALRAGMQVCVHAIGDAATRMTLDAYEEALADAGVPPYPLRVEHAQVIHPADIPRFARLGVIPSMQPTHCTSDMYWAESRLGAERVHNAYAWDALIQSGAWIPGGSDFPVERPDPLDGIYAAAFRMDADGRPASATDIAAHFQIDGDVPDSEARWRNGWYGSQRMAREHAVLAFTAWAARAAGMEQDLGTLERGKWADFTVLSQDILTVPRERFLATKVIATHVGGVRVYSAD